MKGLSIRLPYIQQIILGEKLFEYRNWRTDHRGDLALCSSLKIDGNKECFLPKGCLLAIADLADVTEHDGDYKFKWHLLNIRPVLPRKIRGSLKFFEVREDSIVFLKPQK
jgi:hypothetical protein